MADNRQSRSDIPVQRQHLSSVVQTETAESVRADVKDDFLKHCRVADTQAFLKKMFPISDQIIDAMLATLTTSKAYDEGHWFTTKAKAKEDALYQPFVDAANAIHSAAVSLREGHHMDKNGSIANTKWVDYHSTAPQTEDQYMAQIRPDCLLATNQAHDKIQSLAKDNKKTVEETEEETARKKRLVNIFWLQIVAAVEMKRKDSQKGIDVIVQLVGYLRRIMREQLNRRFVFGITLGPTRMTVWLHDRSGVLGTATSIDIHQNPKDFIRVIAGFALLPAHQLGFDTTMKFYVSPKHIFHTFDLDPEAFDIYVKTSNQKKRWVITCNNGKEYLTVRTLCLAAARIMRGRACVVWAVVLFKNGRIVTEMIRVLKQSWRPEDPNSGSERGMLKDTIGDGVSSRIEFEDIVKINGEKDKTASLIRHGLKVAMPPPSGAKDKGPLKRQLSDDTRLHVRMINNGEDIASVDAPSVEPIARIHTRVMQRIFGWEFKYFQTLRELVQGTLDVVTDHETLYENGLLHRDISSGNILLTWCDGNSGTTGLGTQGRLIDFDRSKRGEKSAEGLLPVVYPDDPQLLLAFLSSTLRNDAGIKRIDLSVANRALEVIPVDETMSYVKGVVRHMKKHRPVDEQVSLITTDMLLWKPTTFPRYRFDSNELQRGSRTGTLPFTSAEILSSERYFTSPVRFFHDAIHDMESVLWVLSYIGMTRSGPGKRREVDPAAGELKDPNHESLPTATYHLFDGTQDEVKRRKLRIFRNPNDYKTDVTRHFHEYFAALKPFMEEWFDLLVLAYKHVNGHEYRSIHYQIKDVLRRMLEVTPLHDDDTKKEMMKFRFKYLEGMVKLDLEAQGSWTGEETLEDDFSPESQGDGGQPLDGAPSTSPSPPRKKLKY